MPRSIKIYNSLTREKATLVPLDGEHVRMYACGVTVYDDNHIGHAMQAVFFDVIRSYLEAAGYSVTYVRNYTDVDDKIIARASKLGMSPRELASNLIERSEMEMSALGVRPATHEPRVSETIPEIIAMIEELIGSNHAYATNDGDVYYRVRKKSDYGKLSNRSPDELRVGTRDIVRGEKEDPLDFALWKKDDTPDACWGSPWGTGRPGWHIECSAMAKKYLGDSFDIHGGGRDLIFPHHENEIAQSEAANQCCYAQVWMHSGLLTIDHQKMSKSTGNSITLKEFLENWPAEVLRLGYILNHYRSNIDFSQDIFMTCRKRLIYFYETLAAARAYSADQFAESAKVGSVESVESAFHQAMCDDFNTPEAIGELQKLAKLINQLVRKKRSSENVAAVASAASCLEFLGGTLGLLKNDPVNFVEDLKQSMLPEIGLTEIQIQQAIQARKAARDRKDWQESDRIRDDLLAKGIVLKDGKDKTDWTVAQLDSW